MGRTVVGEDRYVERFMKYIPPDVIATYTGGQGIINSQTGVGDANMLSILRWILFVVMLIGTPVYLRRVAKVQNRPQIAIATGAFVVWAFASAQSPFETILGPNYHLYGSLLLLLYCFSMPLFNVSATPAVGSSDRHPGQQARPRPEA